MSSWNRGSLNQAPANAPGSSERAIRAWSKATGWSGPLIAGRGVRELLSSVMTGLQGRHEELWLPEDVYPVYWELARPSGLTPGSFRTLPDPDWKFLERTAIDAVVLIPIPLSPSGRMPLSDEVGTMIRWLREGRKRLLIVDSVYTYDFAGSRTVLEALLATGAAVVLGSCSKSWLSVDSLGIAATPEDGFFANVELPLVSALAEVTSKLERHPDLPRRQQEAFHREWRRIEPRLSSCASGWIPPETGYFSVVCKPFEQLLERFDILGVPASVFGSQEALTIVTCLHDLAEHENASR